MGQIGNTDWLNTTTSGETIITDTMISKDATGSAPVPADTNYSTAQTAHIILGGGSAESAVIMRVTLPERNEVLDVDGDPIPEDAVFTKFELQLYVTAAPASDAILVGYVLESDVNIETVTHNHIDGTSAGTAWDPDYSAATTGN